MPSSTLTSEVLTGWGRSTSSRADVARPTDNHAATAAITGAGATPDAGVIGRGLGRSYGDQATNAGGSVVDMTAMTSANLSPTADGVLTVAAGTSIHDMLEQLVPQGWFVPVTPGTRYVTVGGAIAADIHGKNHHRDGSFCDHVEELTLALADGSVVTCSPTNDSQLFWATAGGMGLTGLILSATVKLTPIQTSRVLVDTSRLADLDSLMAAMLESDDTAPFSVAWVDLMTGDKPSRSVLTTGRFAAVGDLAEELRDDPLAYSATKGIGTPGWIPNGLLRTSTLRAFNEVWFRAAPKARQREVQSIARYFHPLDGVRGWNRIYGSGGFVQWQMVVPDGAEETLRRCVESLSMSATPCFLAVLKRLRRANPGHLSFPIQGWTLAADMPARSEGLAGQLDILDTFVAEAGGRIYLAKDARLNPAMVPVMYPRLDEWRAVRDRVDPTGRFRSDMARRLSL